MAAVPGRIVVVGEALVDLVVQPDGSVAAALGGAPFNTARTCGRLGAPVSFIGALGADRFGHLLRHRLADDGVDVSRAPEVDCPTTLAAAELDARGTASYRFYLEGTSAPALGRIGPLDPEVTFVFTGGLALVLEPMADVVAAMLGTVARRPAEHRPVVMVDVNARPRVIDDRHRYLERLRDVFAVTDVVKVSDDDLDVICPGVDPIDAARGLLDQGPSVVLLTAGADEVVVMSRDATGPIEHRIAVEPVEVVDTIGAGDAFGGAVAAWWVGQGLDRAALLTSGDDSPMLDAVRAATVVAGEVCRRRGADPPRRAELADRGWPRPV